LFTSSPAICFAIILREVPEVSLNIPSIASFDKDYQFPDNILPTSEPTLLSTLAVLLIISSVVSKIVDWAMVSNASSSVIVSASTSLPLCLIFLSLLSPCWSIFIYLPVLGLYNQFFPSSITSQP
jgi:uncharacterized membrane protein HdeD (DUF308 family)